MNKRLSVVTIDKTNWERLKESFGRCTDIVKINLAAAPHLKMSMKDSRNLLIETRIILTTSGGMRKL